MNMWQIPSKKAPECYNSFGMNDNNFLLAQNTQSIKKYYFLLLLLTMEAEIIIIIC
jgi:hypothetical protein